MYPKDFCYTTGIVYVAKTLIPKKTTMKLNQWAVFLVLQRAQIISGLGPLLSLFVVCHDGLFANLHHVKNSKVSSPFWILTVLTQPCRTEIHKHIITEKDWAKNIAAINRNILAEGTSINHNLKFHIDWYMWVWFITYWLITEYVLD